MEWGELATHLSLSRSMLDFVRNGHRKPSFKVLRRIEQAEIEAGITPPKSDTRVTFAPPSKKTHVSNLPPIKNVTISELEEAAEHFQAGVDAIRRMVKRMREEDGGG